MDFIWVFENGEIKNVNFIEMPDEPFKNNIPPAYWRINRNYNYGYPYHARLLDIPYTPPPKINPVKQRPYITVYNYDTPQNGFDTHGMWVLTPTRCTITEVLNGKYELSMEHPVDPEGRWEYIRENNIIKALGQLFTIRVVNQQWKGNSGKITCKADHIFYQLSDRWIERDGARDGEEGITGSTVNELINKAGQKMVSMVEEGQTSYTYTIRSNLTVPLVLGAHKWEFLPQGMTPIEFLLGNSGVMEASGGELHRDNFYFSIYKRKEGTVDNAFEIRVGKNQTGIRRTIDLSGLVTYIYGWNNFGYFYALSWTGSTLTRYGVPHHVIREKVFEYRLEGLYAPSNYEVAKEMLEADITQYFKTCCAPLISYDIDLIEVKNNPEYAELTNLGDYRVGNKGYIYDERIGTVEIEITQTITDALMNTVTNVMFGSQRDFINRPAHTAIIDIEPEVVEKGFQVMDSAGFSCADSEGFIIVEYEGV